MSTKHHRVASTPARDYCELGEQAHVAILRPLVEELLGSEPRRAVLDFGCGPGHLSLVLAGADAKRVVAVDREPRMLAEAERTLATAPQEISSRIELVLGDESALAPAPGSVLNTQRFDAVLSSLALMKSPDRETLWTTVAGLVERLETGGALLVIVTHPCFRRQGFATFHYQVPEDYDYWSCGIPYEVILHPENQEREVTLTDHHWTLEHYAEAILRTGALITAVRELPASRDASGNPVGPPAYLALAATRSTHP